MNKKTARRQRDLKSKLLAAVAMLLVSSMMMVTSTYAWFTLSTAPEVTGITTAVGANGNLEMALLPYYALDNTQGGAAKDYGITSAAGDGLLLPVARNVTWGNLVELDDNSVYGLNNITLYPSKLNLDATGKLGANPLATPQYGADGRVTVVEANTITGAFDTAKGQFIEDANGVTDAKGVRAIGESSSMTARQLAYRTAVGNMVSYKGLAQSAAKQSLNSRGSALADIAIKHALGNDSAGYTTEEIAVLAGAIGDLQTAFGHLETAVKNLIIADSIAPNSVTDETYKAIVDGITAGSLKSGDTKYVGSVQGAVVTTEAAGLITKLNTAIASVDSAYNQVSALSAGANWQAISPALNLILNTDTMTVNGMTIPQIQGAGTNPDDEQTGKDELVDKIIDAGFKANLVMNSGSGAYSDIADFAGQYSATTEITVSYGTIQNKQLPATMTATPTASGTVYLTEYTVAEFSGDGTNTAHPISEFYGYIIDLAFRTNAANSSLLLQPEGVDRVYEDNTTNQSTQGGGATMSFSSASATFEINQVKSLMGNLRVVFFNPETSEIIGYARLDMNKATPDESNTEITAPLMMTEANGTAKLDDATTTEINESIKIMELEQNAAELLSVMVYLDGQTMTNADVAADAAKSMVGKMNLQFASSANLVPMEYSDLRAENGGTSDQVVTVPNVTASEGYRASSAYYMNNKLAFTLTGAAEGDTVMVKIGEGTPVQASYGVANGVTGWYVDTTGTTVTASTAIVITVTPATP